MDEDTMGQGGTPRVPPLPLPLSPEPAWGKGGRPLSTTTIVLIVLGALAVVCGLSFVALRGVFVTLSTPGSGSSAEGRLADKAREEYPDFTVVRTSMRSYESDSAAGGRETAVYVDLKYTSHPAFAFTAIYSTAESLKNDPSKYSNLERFFRAGVDPAQPVDSFVAMWLRDHPKDECSFVYESGDEIGGVRYYEVTYAGPHDPRVAPELQSQHLAYDVTADSWTATATEPGGPYEALSEDPAAIAAAVARVLPRFEVLPGALGGFAEPIVVRHVAFPKVHVAVALSELSTTRSVSGPAAFLSGDPKRVDAFARAWTKRHAGTLITDVDPDPEYEGDTDLIEVFYLMSIADHSGVDRTVRFRYDPATNVWTPAK
jgi:hypothetical protein